MKIDGSGPLVGFVYDHEDNECEIAVEISYRTLAAPRYLKSAVIVFGNLTQEERQKFILDKRVRVTVEVLNDEDDNGKD